MNLWLRLLWLIATAWRRPRLELPFATSSLAFRVWPHDVDTSLHMNNGRYWTLMDLGRTDLMIRSGLWRPVLKERWTPVVSAAATRTAMPRCARPRRRWGWGMSGVRASPAACGADGELDRRWGSICWRCSSLSDIHAPYAANLETL